MSISSRRGRARQRLDRRRFICVDPEDGRKLCQGASTPLPWHWAEQSDVPVRGPHGVVDLDQRLQAHAVYIGDFLEVDQETGFPVPIADRASVRNDSAGAPDERRPDTSNTVTPPTFRLRTANMLIP